LFFRYPQLSKRELGELYQYGSKDSWKRVPGSRRDWKLARQWINDQFGTGSKVLDVGCFDGDFLYELGDDYDRYGIEIHPIAAKRAGQRGIHIVRRDFDKLADLNYQFDVIVAFDVIEHVSDPKIFLKSLADVIRTGGMVIVSTGNTQAPSWRFMGSRYWYCTIAEHISFINPVWCNHVVPDCFLVVEQITKFSHVDNLNFGMGYKIKEISKNVLYRSMPWLAAWLRSMGAGKRKVSQHPELKHFPPSWMSAKDHFIIGFRKL
jgi:SAM-dependent methyltransferase